MKSVQTVQLTKMHMLSCKPQKMQGGKRPVSLRPRGWDFLQHMPDYVDQLLDASTLEASSRPGSQHAAGGCCKPAAGGSRARLPSTGAFVSGCP
ncbi:unnamed protein product [Durusdinium trenchii]|uniref:Uncharacterized protein n=1 Tax=Durusdinium trenchii TaxID=1381693 RepID=A0ABP0Q7T6_9DINO